MAAESLQQRFSQSVQKYSDNIAIQQGERQFSYLELDEFSSQIGSFLQDKLLGNKHILLLIDKSPELIAALLGVLKIGGVFVPLDPTYPENRIQIMANVAEAEWVITQNKYLDKLQNIKFATKVNVLVLDQVAEEIFSESLQIFEFPERISMDVEFTTGKYCYIYFTSGSTGIPKGVLGRQRSLLQFILWEIQEFQMHSGMRFGQLTSPSFDPFLRDIFAPLLCGASILIPESWETILNSHKLSQWIDRNEVSVIHTTPSLFKNLMVSVDDSEMFKNLQYVLLAGEKLRGHDIAKFIKLFHSRIQLVNLYGPTETTLAKLFYRIKPEDVQRVNIPVGKPIPQTEVLILDEGMKRCRTEVLGEVYIRTPFISSGYYNQKELTREVFLKNPFNDNPQDIIYKTGDLGKMHTDGNLELVGRTDHQIKIRGMRVEPGEIESKLLKLPNIQEACVVPIFQSLDEVFLSAYLVSACALDIKDLKQELARVLPRHMIPTYYVQLEKMPLLANGKIDYRSLPKPGREDSLGTEYEPPTNELEKHLTEIWSKVLGVREVGITDNFLELGGHSLKAASLVTSIYEELDVELPLRQVFIRPTVQELARYITTLEKRSYSPIQPVEERSHYPVSSAQKRLFVLQQLDPLTVSYNLPKIIVSHGSLDRSRLDMAFRQLIRRHETLRTTFLMIDEELYQTVHQEINFAIRYHQGVVSDISQMIEQFIRPFDLQREPLIRMEVIELEDRNILLFDMHHIISDGISLSILVQDLITLYQNGELEPLKIQYRDFAVWQNQQFTSEMIGTQEEFWLKKLEPQSFAEGKIPVLNLPTDYPRPKIRNFQGGQVVDVIDQRLTHQLYQLTHEHGATLYMVLLTAYNLLLSRYSSQNDLIVGTPIAGRNHPDLQKLIGMFVNTLCLRTQLQEEQTLLELLEEVKENSLQAFENQDYPFEMLVDRLELPIHLNRNPLFDTMFALQNMHLGETEFTNSGFSQYEFQNRIAKFDISLNAFEVNTEIILKAEYATSLFTANTVQRMLKHFKNIISAMVLQPTKRVREVEFLTKDEREALLVEWNNTNTDFPADKTIHQVLTEQSMLHHDQVALRFAGQSMSYGELDQRSDQLAQTLIHKGATRDSLIGIMVQRSLTMVIGIWGILKAGAGYLPIDPTYPIERQEYILQDSRVALLLTDQLESELSFQGEIIRLPENAQYSAESYHLKVCSAPNDLAYVIYTSGSTGNPKGVMIEHRSVINRLNWMQKNYPLDYRDVVLQKTPFTFDVSVWELFWWAFTGASLCLLTPEGEKVPQQIAETIENEQITVLHFVPSMLSIFLEYIADNRESHDLSSLRQVFVSGEALKVQQAEEFDQLLTQRWGTKLTNLYGPTEATVDVTYYDCLTLIENQSIPIGRPIDNTQLYILNEALQLQPIGVPGELCIAGIGLARGYLNQPEMTKEKFVPHPFKQEERIYRTGDLARWRSDGQIEFMGRIDFQVKIRGFRIELGEIEQQLLQHPEVREVVVTTGQDSTGDNYLKAYYVAERELVIQELREFLTRLLPEYMIPAFFIQLSKLPLTHNGKVDRHALPNELSLKPTQCAVPKTEMEERVLRIWVEILDREQISIDDNFMEIGGHSLKGTRIIARLSKELNMSLNLTDLFENPTIRSLARWIETKEQGGFGLIIQQPEMEYYDLSHGQKRIWIMEDLGNVGAAYNMHHSSFIEGTLDILALEKAYQAVIQRHEILRTSFVKIDNLPKQRVHLAVPFSLNYQDIRNAHNQNELIAQYSKHEITTPFDLATVPLIRGNVLHIEDQRYLLLNTMHHIIADGWSLGIFVRELLAFYYAFSRRISINSLNLPELRIQYKDYVAWQRQQLTGESLQKLEGYWLNEFLDQPPLLDLPTDFPRKEVRTFNGEIYDRLISNEVIAELERFSESSGCTLFMTLLASIYVLLYRYTTQTDITIGTPIAGRTHPDLENLIGLFVNFLAVRAKFASTDSFIELLYQVKEKMLLAYRYQEYPFDELVLKLPHKNQRNRGPLFDIVVVLQNLPDESELEEHFAVAQNQEIAGVERDSQHDLLFSFIEQTDGFLLHLHYNRDLFIRDTVIQMVDDYLAILHNLLNDCERPISETLSSGEDEAESLTNAMAEFDF